VFLDRLGGEWRWLFVAAALPAFLPYVVRRALLESPYWLVLLGLVALAQFPGYAASLWLVEAWGRKPTLATFLALGGVSALTFALANSTAVYVAALFFVGFFNLGAWGAVYPYTSELFPTRLRSTAFGMVEGVGKAAAIAGPYLFGYLLDITGATVWSLTFVAAVMAAGALVTLLGRETRGAKLT
jgi:MFS transporter, putative metabolite:H+ symporter